MISSRSRLKNREEVKEIGKYDKRKTYDAVIAEKVKELSALCYQNGIPVFISVAVANTEDGKTEYRNEYVSPEKASVRLTDNQLCRHVNVLNGFVTVLPSQMDEIEIDM